MWMGTTIAINSNAWDRLEPAAQAILKEQAVAAGHYGFDLIDANNAAGEATLKEAGVEYGNKYQLGTLAALSLTDAEIPSLVDDIREVNANNNILAQAGQSMLAQANQSNQGTLTLLGR